MSIASTVVVTFLFGLFGLIPAVINSRRERANGRATSRYWEAFWWTMAASTALYVGLIAALVAVLASSTSTGSPATSSALAAAPASALDAAGAASGATVQDARLQALTAKYGVQIVATAAKLDRRTAALLANDTSNRAAGLKAVSEVSGIKLSDVVTVAMVENTHYHAMQALQAMDPATRSQWLADPSRPALMHAAESQVGSTLGASLSVAASFMRDLRSIPAARLQLVIQDGPRIVAAASQLAVLTKMPRADLAILTSRH